jgi:hypothetical protein
MRKLAILLLCALSVTLAGCTPSESSMKVPGAISTLDLNQVDYLRSWLSQIPEIKDRHEVIPGSEEIVIKFKDDLPEGRTPIFKERLTQLKNEMQQKMKKPINTLVFEFPSQTIRI